MAKGTEVSPFPILVMPALMLFDTGFLVPEFLQSTSSGIAFLNSLSTRSPDYADFLMVTLDFS